MNIREADDESPWDVKTIRLSLGGLDDSNGWVTFEVFNDNCFAFYEGDKHVEGKWYYEEIPIEAAERLRDFLIYAVPKRVPVVSENVSREAS